MGAVTAKVDEKRAQAAEIDRRIAEKMAELDRLDGEIGEKIELRNEVGDNLQREQRRLESVRQAAGRLEVAIEDLARKLAPRSARMTTKALKRDLAALERDYGEDDDRSPKARAAEAQRAARARDANRDHAAPQRTYRGRAR